MKKYKTEIVKQPVKFLESKTCDKCGRSLFHPAGVVCLPTIDNMIEDQEAINIRFTGGFGSVFGDGSVVDLDICQNCFKDAFGDCIRPESEDHEDEPFA